MLRVWTVRWGDRVVAAGTGALPAEYGLPQPRVSRSDRAVVRNGPFSAEVRLAPRPPRPSRWGAPDLHFVKVFTMCVMAFAAVLVVVRERAATLQAEKRLAPPEEHDIFAPRYARFTAPHRGFTAAAEQHRSPIAKRDLDRIQRFAGKAKALKARETIASSLATARAFGLFTAMRVAEPADVRVGGFEDAVVGGVVGGVALGGLGVRGGGEAGGGSGLGSVNMIGRRKAWRVEAGERNRPVLAAARSRVVSCLGGYEGEMSTDLYLFANGRVQSVTVDGPPEPVQRCVSRTLESLEFPGGDRHIRARWTMG